MHLEKHLLRRRGRIRLCDDALLCEVAPRLEYHVQLGSNMFTGGTVPRSFLQNLMQSHTTILTTPIPSSHSPKSARLGILLSLYRSLESEFAICPSGKSEMRRDLPSSGISGDG